MCLSFRFCFWIVAFKVIFIVFHVIVIAQALSGNVMGI